MEKSILSIIDEYTISHSWRLKNIHNPEIKPFYVLIRDNININFDFIGQSNGTYKFSEYDVWLLVPNGKIILFTISTENINTTIYTQVSDHYKIHSMVPLITHKNHYIVWNKKKE